MDELESVKICHTRCNLRELEMVDRWGDQGATGRGLTSCRRFALGLDLVYSFKVPLGIHSERMRNWCRSFDTKTPNRGRIFGWDRCFQPIIS